MQKPFTAETHRYAEAAQRRREVSEESRRYAEVALRRRVVPKEARRHAEISQRRGPKKPTLPAFNNVQTGLLCSFRIQVEDRLNVKGAARS